MTALFNHITNQLVSGFNVVETFETDTAFKTLADLFDILFFMA
jgi:hypothetical protein